MIVIDVDVIVPDEFVDDCVTTTILVLIGKRERANLVVRTAQYFGIYIYLFIYLFISNRRCRHIP